MAYNQGKNPFSKNPLNFNSPLNSFDSLVGKLMNQGKSKEAAKKIAGKVARMKMKGAGSGPTAAQKARMKSSPAKQAKPDFLDLDKDGNTTEPMKEAAKGSPANLKEKSPAELKSPVDKKLVGKQKNLPEGLKKAIEAAPESPAKMKSPMKKHGDKFRKRAMKLSEKAEQGDYDYDNPKVVELLNKAKEADKKHEGSPANLEGGGGDPNIKTEELDEVVVNAPKDRSREAIKNRKAKDKKEGKSKREIRLAKTKDKAKAAKQATVDAKDKDSQKLARAKANRLAKRVARQEGRAERRKVRKSKKMFRENKEQAITKSRRLQKEKRDKGASALAMKSSMKKDDKKK